MYDMRQLEKLKTLEAKATDAVQAFRHFDRAALADGAVPARYKELIALGVAFATQCPYCIEIHAERARAAGATEAEIAETVMVTAALHACAAVTHGMHALKG
ncbi:MAG TPA: carboxymuconolactone decarboxylase family protein [Alphaproteobacteria bacterium]|nr:carboxymuconolactone decarboxylase family protein [Alphaproteobacteria bacterium]